MNLTAGAYTLTTRQRNHMISHIWETDIATRAHALYLAVQRSKEQRGLTIYGWEQTAEDRKLDFIVLNGAEVEA